MRKPRMDRLRPDWPPWQQMAPFVIFFFCIQSSLCSTQFHFTRTSYNVSIPENSPPRTNITCDQKMGIYLKDPALTVTYSIDGFDNYFSVHEHRVGDFSFLRMRSKPCISLETCFALNREGMSSYNLRVNAEGWVDGTVVESAQVDIQVYIQDVNDALPVFQEDSYKVTIPEDYPVLTSVIQINADDADVGSNGEVYFSFRQKTDKFAIHPTSGVVTLTKPLNYDTASSHRLVVIAKDRGQMLFGDSFTDGPKTILRIQVTKVNKHAPEITVITFPSLSQDSPVGTVFAVVQVNDLDDGENGEIVALEIKEVSLLPFFTILEDNISGVSGQYQIQVSRSLEEAELGKVFNLTLVAKDRSIEQKTTEKTFQVIVDRAWKPTDLFNEPFFNMTISELTPVKTPILVIPPYDSVFDKRLSFSLSGSNLPFVISSKSGVLAVSNPLDREEQSYYSFDVEVRDELNHLVASANVDIYVSDANDNSPVFEESLYEQDFPENQEVGSFVIQIVASDPDDGENGFVSYSISNINDIPFKIDHMTGIITSTQVLDYETMRRDYTLRVRASDWGTPFRREAEIEVRIHLAPVNDNPPLFEKVNCTGAISRSLHPGEMIELLSTIDLDEDPNRQMMITAGNINNLFYLNHITGNLSLSRPIQDIDPLYYTLKVVVTDGPDSSSFTFVNISIVSSSHSSGHVKNVKMNCQNTDAIQQMTDVIMRKTLSNIETDEFPGNVDEVFNRNRKSPSFELDFPESITVREDLKAGSLVMAIIASDPDPGYNGMIMYSIPEGNDNFNFKIDPENGQLMILIPLDHEERDRFELTIRLMDLGQPQRWRDEPLVINIEDANDNAPVFDNVHYRVEIAENVPVGTSFLSIHAIDADSGDNGDVRYRLDGDSSAFSISGTGEIRVVSDLDRELKEVLNLRVIAHDSSTETQLGSTAEVSVTLADINDNPPRCILPIQKVKMREDLPVGAAMFSVQAVDPDAGQNSTIQYQLLRGHRDKFEIDRNYGVVRLMEPLDFESTSLYNITVGLRDSGVPSLSSTCQVVVEVIDVNENMYAPRFESFVVVGSVLENSGVGTMVISVTAEDMDQGIDGEVSYSIKDGSGLGRFTIDNRGVIRTREELDRESHPHFWLTVYAQDHGAVPLHSILYVYIEVEDVNDNAPVPTLPVFKASVPENSEEGLTVVQIEASDIDSPEYQNITYSLGSKKSERYFSIDPFTGVITTSNRPLDREKNAQHDFEVLISDNGDQPLTSLARVIITVLDENDNDPNFHRLPPRILVPATPEGADENRVMVRVVAMDADVGENAVISYIFSEIDSKFSVNAITGEVVAEKALMDGEQFTLWIEAMDNGRPRRSSRMRLIILVTPPEPVSQNAPRFTDDGVFNDVEIPESVVPPGFVTYVVAEDDDGDAVTYDITGGNDGYVFMMDRTGGVIALAGRLDCETKREYALEVTASDGHLSTTAIVNIEVLNINDNPPVFDQEIYEVDVFENTPKGKKILTVHATDADIENKLTYSILSTADPSSKEKFSIHSSSGDITIRRTLDHESLRQHILNIKVKDQGLTTNEAYARVIVTVHDSNDHMPYFSTQDYVGQVFETAAVGSKIVEVQAYDKDQGHNAEVTYSILSGNLDDAFRIDPVLGTITVGHELDVDVLADYSLTVQAKDGGTPPLKNTCIVNVTVTLSSDAPPRFTETEYVAEVAENSPIGEYVMQPSVISKSSVFFDITDGNNDDNFVIDPSSGVVSTKTNLDHEERTVHNVTIRATNMAGHSASIKLTVHVLDVNDNEPFFLDTVYEGQISEAAPINTVISDLDERHLVVTAVDYDMEQNARLVYSIVEEEAQKYFDIDENTGAIRTLLNLDHESKDLYEFTVQVRDSGVPRLRAQTPAVVKVHVLDINDSPPLFIQNVFETSLLLPTYSNVLVLQMVATDPDTVSIGNLHYMIKAGNNGDHFKINEITGDVIVNVPPTETGIHELDIEVSDGLHINVARAVIHADNKIPSSLRFPSNETFGSVWENSTEVFDIAFLNVLGTDLNEHVEFSLLNPSPLFEIKETAGILRTTGLPFDREVQDVYHLVMEARDSRNPPRIAHIIIHVEVQDINDNWPIFVHPEYNAVVQVDAKVGEVVRKVEALDRDSGDNGEVEYTLVEGSEGYFTVETETGEVIVQQSLGQEVQNRNFTLKIKASDKGNPPHSSYVYVPLTVRNRAMPIFHEQYYRVSIPEDVHLFSSVLPVEAISPSGRDLIYSISAGNMYNQFDINPESGVVSVVGALDYEAQNRYSLTVKASDTLTGVSSTVTLDITVSDVNDMPPRFTNRVYHKVLSEGFTIGSTVLQVLARDLDSTANNQIRYHIEGDDNVLDTFRMEPSSGIIFSLRSLDFETRRTYNFTAVATDSGVPQLNGKAIVSIDLLDVNDNPPVFVKSVYTCSVSEAAGRGSFVTAVAAFDPDISDEGRLVFSIGEGNEDMAFTIEPSTGVITLSLSREPDLYGTYHLNVSVSDYVFTSSAQVIIIVSTINSHTPSFSLNEYNINFPENETAGSTVYTVIAQDDDVGVYGKVTYDIIGDKSRSLFQIDSVSGEVTSRISIDQQAVGGHTFTIPIKAVDGGGKTGYTKINMNLRDKNENTPRFELSEYEAYILEDAEVGFQIIQVHASDDDVGSNAFITYRFLQGTSIEVMDIFSVNARTGFIFTKKPILGSAGNFQFFIEAVDGGNPQRSTQVPVSLSILPSGTVIPVFDEASILSTSLSEDTEVGTTLTRFMISNSNATTTFSLVPGNGPHTNNPVKFGVTPEGDLLLTSPLDHETCSWYKLTVKAIPVDVIPPVAAFHEVAITVTDVNDNAPVFEEQEYAIAIEEGSEIGSRVIQVKAFDADTGQSGEVSYAIVYNYDDVTDVFEINSHTGVISTIADLDREMVYAYTIIVSASDNSDSGVLSSTTTVQVLITDINDSPPVFSRVVYPAKVSEDAGLGTIVTNIEALDADVNGNAEIKYYIVGGDLRGQFVVDCESGVVTVNGELDREQDRRYTLNVTATDGAYTDFARVEIIITDVNDNTPICHQVRYEEDILENVGPGQDILQVYASDGDDGANAKLTYSLKGDGSDLFAIDFDLGMLQTSIPLDYETKSTYKFEVVATDGGGLYCTSEISIGLLDENDNPPLFSQIVYNESVSENTTVNSLLTRVQAIDKDTGANRQFFFTLVTSEDNSFIIDRQSGIVTLQEVLDRENCSEYNLTLKATDLTQPDLTSFAYLIINVLDENDNEPKFELDLYNKTVHEDIEVGTIILSVRAISEDVGVNALVTYQIVTGNEHGKFAIDSNTGDISIVSELDYEIDQAYYLTVKATDAGLRPLSDTTMVNVFILDTNDNYPQFSQDIYTSEINELARVRDSVVQVMASDDDSGSMGLITYSIESGDLFNQFYIDGTNGLIRLGATLDREQISSYSLTVRASDNAAEPKHSDVTVRVLVSDINDNPPRFSQQNYTINKKENTEVNSELLSFNVTDNDTPKNGAPFTFTILSGNINNAFRVTHDGVLVNNIALNREEREIYKLVVRATDNGKPPLYSDSYITVRVIKPQNAPIIASPLVITIQSYQNRFPGGFIARIKAVDSDPYDVLEYDLVKDTSGAFSVESDDGTLFASPNLDAGFYSLNVSVSDGQFVTYGQVEINVVDIPVDMLQNSIVVRFADLPAKKFLTLFVDTFKHTIANLIRDANSDDVKIISIIPAEDTARDTEVQFAVMSTTGRGYVKSKMLLRRVNSSMSSLEDRMHVAVVKVYGDPCLYNPCKDTERCSGSLNLDFSSIETISTDTLGFVSARHLDQFECTCRDTSCMPDAVIAPTLPPVDPCSSSPCPSNKQCVLFDDSYQCVCRENDPECTDTPSGPMSFSDDSFVIYRNLELSTTLTQFSVAIHTTSPNGVIMHGKGTYDFSILEIEEGILYYHFECGSGEAHIRVTQQRVDDGKWHQVSINRQDNTATVTLDNQHSSSDTAPGFKVKLNLDSIVFGALLNDDGLQRRKKRSFTSSNGFTGCMGDMSLNGRSISMSGDSGSKGVDTCPASVLISCQEDPCHNGGRCVDHGYRYSCVCPSGWTGPHCQHHQGPCAANPCWNGGTCNPFNNDFWCSCQGLYFGKTCQALSCADRPCQHGGQCVELNDARGLTCKCEGTGYTGIYCHEKIESCAEDPCRGVGTCVNFSNTYRCCPQGTSDPDCKMVMTEGVSITSTPRGITMMEIIIIVGVVLIILIVVILLAIVVRRKQRSRPEARTTSMGGERYTGIYSNDPDGKLSDVDFPPGVPAHGFRPNPVNPVPPRIPEYPAGYTRSTHTSLNNLDSERCYDDQMYQGQPISQAPSLPPLPSNSASDNESITKPAWDFDSPSNNGSYVEGRGSVKNMPIAPHPLQHSQPSIIPPARQCLPPPSGDPPAYQQVEKAPSRDKGSMMSVNTEDSENLKEKDINSIPSTPPPTPNETILKESNDKKLEDELKSSIESVTNALENVCDLTESDDDNESKENDINTQNELNSSEDQILDSEKEELLSKIEQKDRSTEGEQEPLLQKGVPSTPKSPKNVRFNMQTEVNQFEAELEPNEGDLCDNQESSFGGSTPDTVEGDSVMQSSSDGIQTQTSHLNDAGTLLSGNEETDERQPFLSDQIPSNDPPPYVELETLFVPRPPSPNLPPPAVAVTPEEKQARLRLDPRRKDLQWDDTDWAPKSENGLYNADHSKHSSNSPTNTNITQPDDFDIDDEYVGEDTDYPLDHEEETALAIRKATENFRQELESYPPLLGGEDDPEGARAAQTDYSPQHRNHYMPPHRISQNSIPPDTEEHSSEQMPFLPHRNHLPRRRSFDQRASADFSDFDTTHAHLDNLSMSAYTDTNASCSDVSGMYEPESEVEQSGYDSIDENLVNLSNMHTDV